MKEPLRINKKPKNNSDGFLCATLRNLCVLCVKVFFKQEQRSSAGPFQFLRGLTVTGSTSRWPRVIHTSSSMRPAFVGT